jgi:hypothetical protein
VAELVYAYVSEAYPVRVGSSSLPVTTQMWFIIDIFFRIYQGNVVDGLLFSFAPYGLTPEKYWYYLSDEKGNHAFLAKWSLVTVLILFIGLGVLVYRYGVNYWTIALFIILLILFFFGVLYAVTSTSSRMWWRTLLAFSVVSCIFSIILIPLFGSGLITLYLSVSHFISLVRVKKLVK